MFGTEVVGKKEAHFFMANTTLPVRVSILEMTKQSEGNGDARIVTLCIQCLTCYFI
jgi:hypothetical protein